METNEVVLLSCVGGFSATGIYKRMKGQAVRKNAFVVRIASPSQSPSRTYHDYSGSTVLSQHSAGGVQHCEHGTVWSILFSSSRIWCVVCAGGIVAVGHASIEFVGQLLGQ